MQRQVLKQQQIEIAQSRMELEQVRLLQKSGNGLTVSTAPSMFIPPMMLKRDSPHPTGQMSNPMEEEVHDRTKSQSPNTTGYPMEEENIMQDRMMHVTISNKRPLADIMGDEAEEVSHKSHTRRSG